MQTCKYTHTKTISKPDTHPPYRLEFAVESYNESSSILTPPFPLTCPPTRKPSKYLLCVNIVDADMQIHTHQDDFKTRQCFMTYHLHM